MDKTQIIKKLLEQAGYESDEIQFFTPKKFPGEVALKINHFEPLDKKSLLSISDHIERVVELDTYTVSEFYLIKF
jgi:hypothetical protein